MTMKVIAFNGSPRKDGNTAILILKLLHELKQEGIETELVHLSHNNIHGCISCYKCFKNQDQCCAVKDDAANEYIEKITGAQGVILGSPVYFMDVTPEMKALIDRAGFVSLANGGMFRNKVGSMVSTFRRGGVVHTIDTMNHFFLFMEMIVVGRADGVGGGKVDVEKDTEGLQSVKSLGQRMACLMKKLHGWKEMKRRMGKKDV